VGPAPDVRDLDQPGYGILKMALVRSTWSGVTIWFFSTVPQQES
jgi:hypothetical protein